MAPLLLFSLNLLCFLFLSKTHLSVSIDTTTPDIHDILPQYGLPRGLVPGNVKSYTITPSGSFSVQLTAPCYVHFDDEVVYYGTEIGGDISYGAVRRAFGIQAKKLFLWLPVTGMEVDGEDDGMIKFYVGSLSKRYPADKFEEIPACRKKVGLRTSLESI